MKHRPSKSSDVYVPALFCAAQWRLELSNWLNLLRPTEEKIIRSEEGGPGADRGLPLAANIQSAKHFAHGLISGAVAGS